MPKMNPPYGMLNLTTIYGDVVDYVILWDLGYAEVWVNDPHGATCGDCVREDHRVF